MRLEQSVTLRPFVGELVLSPLITGRARKNKIPGVVRTPLAGDRDNVVNLVAILSLFKGERTPVALSLLRLILFFNILSGILAAYCSLACFAQAAIDTLLQPASRSQAVSTFIHTEWLWIGLTAGALLFSSSLSVVVCPGSLVLAGAFQVSPTPPPCSACILLWMGLSVLILSFLSTNLAGLREAIFYGRVFREVCISKWLGYLAYLAGPGFWWSVFRTCFCLLIKCFVTLSTILIQVVFCARASIKVVPRSRQLPFTPGTAFHPLRDRRRLAIFSNQPPAFFAKWPQPAFMFLSGHKILNRGREIFFTLITAFQRYFCVHLAPSSVICTDYTVKVYRSQAQGRMLGGNNFVRLQYNKFAI